MKRKLMLLSTLILVSILVAGGTMAWFTDNKSIVIKLQVKTSADNGDTSQAVDSLEEPTVEVEVIESGKKKITSIEVNQAYEKNISVKSLGSEDAYIRVRLIPQWSNANLSVSNIVLDLADNPDWENRMAKDGYYYYKSSLAKDETINPLKISIRFEKLEPEYADETFTLKLAAEGIQGSGETWEEAWDLD